MYFFYNCFLENSLGPCTLHISPSLVTFWGLKSMMTDSHKPPGILPKRLIVFSNTPQNWRINVLRRTEKVKFGVDLCSGIEFTTGELQNVSFTELCLLKRPKNVSAWFRFCRIDGNWQRSVRPCLDISGSEGSSTQLLPLPGADTLNLIASY